MPCHLGGILEEGGVGGEVLLLYSAGTGDEDEDERR